MSPLNRPARILLAAASALALGACATVGPNFKAPAPPSGAAGSGYAMAGDAAAPGVRLSPDARVAGAWWQAFGSPELDGAIRQALADSPSLAEARATLEKAQAQAAATRGAELPQVDANASAQRERINTQSFGFTGFPSPTINLFSIGGSVSYDLDLFGGRKRATEEAAAKVERASRQADAAYLTISGNMAMQAMRIASLRAQIAAVREVVTGDSQVLDMVRKAQAAGGEAQSATATGTAQLAEDEALIPPLERDLAAARHQMALLAGKSPAEWTAPDFDLARLTAPADIPLSLPSNLVRQRPDILAAQAEMHAATAAIGVAVANQYPDIRLSASLTQGSIKPENLFNYASSGWNLLSGVSAPVFHGGTLKAERQAAEAEARASLARYQQTVLRAFVQVSDVLSDLGSDQRSIEALQRAADAAQANAKDAQTAYRLGGGSLLDAIDAQRTLARTRRSLAQAQGQRMSDIVQLYAATATDWRAASQTASR
jgi:NodT family efflux transporter outer membrane factor (OMF) lipoprotein